ncbi:hypothetical protein ACHAXT_001821 [Thalassiosira profunda]
MTSRLLRALGLLAVLLAPLPIAAVDSVDLNFDDGRYADSIAQQLEHAHQLGCLHPKLSLRADMVDDQAMQQEAEIAINVREPIQAVTSATILREHGGRERRVGQLSNTILVADGDADAGEDGTIALIKVDATTGEVDGVVQKPGREKLKLVQKRGERARAYKDKEFVPPKWECGVGKPQSSGGGTGRHLLHDHGHATIPEGHSHNNHNEQHRHHDHSHHLEDTEDALSHVRDGLRGSNVRLGERRRLEDGRDGYHYQIDLFVEVDKFLVDLNGGIFEPNTVDYVNTIVTGANAIYEPEIDTHINVVAIELTNHYDDISGNDATVDAVIKMQEIYGGNSWHREGINLHHALLGNPMGGGIAFIGSVCNPLGGFGLSAELQGTFESIDSATVWDLVVFTHEIGHNFNSLHTHTTGLEGIPGYSPVVDNCTPVNGQMQCPLDLPLEGSATIMSYCHLCNGGLQNIDYTFGGKYTGGATGSGSRGDLDSYENSPLAGGVSFEPRRVNKVMWEHISTRGDCAEAPTPVLTDAPTAGPTAMTNSPSPKPTTALPTVDIESGPRIEVTIPSSLVTTATDPSTAFVLGSMQDANENSLETALQKTIKDVAESGLDKSRQKVQKVVILDIMAVDEGPIPRLKERKHQGNRALADEYGPRTARRLEGFLDVQYELLLVEKCNGNVDTGGNRSCEGHTTTMATDVTFYMNQEVENGGFTSALQSNAAACGSNCDAIANSSVEAVEVDTTNIVVVPIEPVTTGAPTSKPTSDDKKWKRGSKGSKAKKANRKPGSNDKSAKDTAKRKRKRKHAATANLADGDSSFADQNSS